MADLVVLSSNLQGLTHISSLQVAEIFDRRHDNVLRTINSLIEDGMLDSSLSEESSYKNDQNKTQPMFLLTEAGFATLSMAMNLSSEEDKALRKEVLQKFHAKQAEEAKILKEAKRIQKIITEKGMKYLNTVPYEEKKVNVPEDIAEQYEIEEGQHPLNELDVLIVAEVLVYDVRGQIASREVALERKEAFLHALYEWDSNKRKDKCPQPKQFKVRTEFEARFALELP